MNQEKVGSLLKELRKEKCLTQEQLAEKFNVSSRTVSRWENGVNMPDLDILIEISELYDVELRELLDGERKSGNMEKETKEIVLDAVEYTNLNTKKNYVRVQLCITTALIILFASLLITGDGGVNSFLGVSILRDFVALAPAFVMILLLIVEFLVIRYGLQIDAYQKRINEKKK